MKSKNYHTKTNLVKNWLEYPELVFINRFASLTPMLLLTVLVLIGEILRFYAPQLNTNGLQMGTLGFCIPTVILFNITATINSLDHMFGSQRYDTGDQSRNNWCLAVLSMGEGWHNNHHYYPVSARNGFFWWEIDLTYYLLKILEKVGIVWDVTVVSPDKMIQKSQM
jgi:stearoyl-CoA desaturase (delta-9 desaturase)